MGWSVVPPRLSCPAERRGRGRWFGGDAGWRAIKPTRKGLSKQVFGRQIRRYLYSVTRVLPNMSSRSGGSTVRFAHILEHSSYRHLQTEPGC